MRPRVAVIGTVVADEIVRPGRPSLRSLGGIAYTVAALASLAGDRLDIVPLCRVGSDLERQLRACWLQLPGVQLQALVPCPAPHTRVHLDYGAAGVGGGERLERLQHPLPPISAAELALLGRVDLALVNCISGFDLTIDALEILAGRSRVYLDVHSLALARRPDGTREAQPVAEGRRWLACADWVQCNQREAASLTSAVGTVADLAGLLRAAGRPRCALLTRGADGVLLVRPGGEVAALPAPVRSAGDPTGAGDTFGAAFVAATLDGLPDEPAAARAVRAATASCLIDGDDRLAGLSEALRYC